MKRTAIGLLDEGKSPTPDRHYLNLVSLTSYVTRVPTVHVCNQVSNLLKHPHNRAQNLTYVRIIHGRSLYKAKAKVYCILRSWGGGMGGCCGLLQGCS